MVEHAGHANSLLLAPGQNVLPVTHGLPTWQETKVAVQFNKGRAARAEGPGPGAVAAVGGAGPPTVAEHGSARDSEKGCPLGMCALGTCPSVGTPQ